MSRKKLTNKDVAHYLAACLGYDEMMIDELKDTHKPLRTCLNKEEEEDVYNYYDMQED